VKGYAGALVLLLVLLLLGPALAVAEQSGDFAFGIPLQTGGPGAFYQLELPRAVYEKVTRADLGDLRVFNGAGEVVPHALRPRVTVTRVAVTPVALTLFPIRTDAPEGVGGANLRLERHGEHTVVELRTPEGKAVRGTTLAGYLADARALDVPIRAVVLRPPPQLGQLIARVTIEASDDLRRWDTLASGAPVVRLSSGGQRLEQLRVEIPARTVKYLRLSWPARGPAVELAGLEVEPGEATVEAARQWTRAVGAPTRDRPGEYEFDLDGLFPVDRIRVALPQPNTVVALEILARSRPAEPWRRVVGATVYRLTREGDELTSGDLEVALTPERSWLVRVDQRGGGIGGGPLGIVAGWVPHRLVFAARGAGPFELVYGRLDAQSAAFPIATLLPDYKGEDDLDLRARAGATPSAIAIGTAQPAGPARQLGGEAALSWRLDWRRWVLWGSLVLGVLVLGAMAIRLGRQMSGSASN
jgi:hypothetical protein